MSDKNTDTNWKPWVPKELIDWELKVKEDTGLDEKEDENQEKEVVQQQKVLEQINMLDDMKEKAQNWAMLKALRQGKPGLSGRLSGRITIGYRRRYPSRHC